MVGLELQRAFSAKPFRWACGITLGMLIYGCIDYIFYRIGNVLVTAWWEVYLNGIYLGNAVLTVFYPIVVMIPYVLSYRRERDSGYMQLMLLKGSRRAYRRAKILAVAASAFMTMLLPNLCWMLVCRFVLGVTDPAYDDCRHNISFAFSLYDSHPGLYMVLWAVHLSVLGAVFAILGLGVSAVVKNKYLAVMLPFCYCIFSSTVLASIQDSFAALDLLPLQIYSYTDVYPLGFYTVPIYEAVLVIVGVILFLVGDHYAGRA